MGWWDSAHVTAQQQHHHWILFMFFYISFKKNAPTKCLQNCINAVI
jgi:hypothetical protein